MKKGDRFFSNHDTVMVYVTQEGLKDNLHEKYGDKIHIINSTFP